MFSYRWLSVNALIFLITCFSNATGQEILLKQENALSILSERGEIIFRFRKPGSLSLEEISRRISIDNFKNDTVTAYADVTGFKWFTAQKVEYRLVEPPSLKQQIKKTALKYQSGYPSYSDYLSLMNSFALDYPDICRLNEFGSSVEGRKLLAVKISDSPDEKEREPVLFYTATMHGDEPLGYVLMLKLISYLLMEYPGNPEIKELIDNTEIWINPLSNPDGAYFVSDSSIFGSKRFNKNNVDLNRDFPKIPADNADFLQKQLETRYMISFMQLIKPTLAANFHGGVEVLNYPWDTWRSDHPDEGWYRKISRSYADTVHAYAPSGYMTYLENGITKGIDWYQVVGSRQDYTNFYLYGREITIELSNDKIPPETEIENYWKFNRRSLIDYINASHDGFRGTISDSITGEPVSAQVRILEHDRDNSFVVSDMYGNYFRLIDAGHYNVLYSAPGYRYKTLPVSVIEGIPTQIDVKLSRELKPILFPNPFTDHLRINIPYPGYTLSISFIDLAGRKVKHIEYPVANAGENEIPVGFLAPGYYMIQMTYHNQTWQFKAIRSPE